jgi:predicted SAM-dependent methyltransferase
VVADINKEWKFAKPNSAEYILIEDGLEHVDSLEHFLKNVSRVLTTNGTIEIQVPHFKNPIANLLPKYWERFAYVSGLRIWMKKRGTANDAYS